MKATKRKNKGVNIMRTKKTIKKVNRDSSVISEGTLTAIIENMREEYIINRDDETSTAIYQSLVFTLVKKKIPLTENAICCAIDCCVERYNETKDNSRPEVYKLYQAAEIAEASGLFKKAIDIYAMILRRIPVHLGGGSVTNFYNVTDKLSSIAKKSGLYSEVLEVFVRGNMHKYSYKHIVTQLGDAALKSGDIDAAITIYGVLSIEEHRHFDYDGINIGNSSLDKKMEELARKNKMLDKVMDVYMRMADEYVKDSSHTKGIKAYISALRIASEAGLESDKEKIEVKLTELGYKRKQFPEWFAALVQ